MTRHVSVIDFLGFNFKTTEIKAYSLNRSQRNQQSRNQKLEKCIIRLANFAVNQTLTFINPIPNPDLCQIIFCLNLFIDACKHINLNLEYFTTRSLVKRAPEALIEIRKQIVQNPDFNINNGKLSWLCESPREWSSLKDYAIYQTKLYHEKNGKERMKKFYIGLSFCSHRT